MTKREIIGELINELNGRKGFDDWWYKIDEDIQEEITESLIEKLP